MFVSRWLAVLCLFGCTTNVDFSDTNFRCVGPQMICPEDFECRDTRCVLVGSPIRPGRFRRLIDINYEGAETLGDFPVLIQLDSTTIDYTTAGLEGRSLRFTDLDDNLLAFEIERWNPDGRSQVWLGMPSIVPNDDADGVYMYWGASEPPLARASTEVWDSATVAVWHLDDDPALGMTSAILDSTASRHHGTASVSMDAASLMDSPLGVGLYFDNGDDTVRVPDDPAFELANYSYTFWIRGDAAPVSGGANSQPIYNADDQFNFSWDHSNPSFAQAAAHRDATVFLPSQIPDALAGETWYFIGVTYDGEFLTVFLDGQEVGSVAHLPPRVASGDFALGNDPDAVRFAGALDEVHISTGARSPGFIAALYESATNAGFLNFGPVEEL